MMGMSRAQPLPTDFSFAKDRFASTDLPTPPTARDYSYASTVDHLSSDPPIQNFRCPHCSHLIRCRLVAEPVQPVYNMDHHSNERQQWLDVAWVPYQRVPTSQA
jgi:hypothetical protein